jgi:predicted membrane channel-forming protein YqfA (hemolysin III family)
MITPNPDPFADLPWSNPETSGEPVSAAIRSARRNSRRPVAGMSAGMRLTLCLMLSSLAAVVGYLFGIRHDHSELSLRMGVYGALGWAVVQAAVLAVGFSPMRARSPRATRLALAMAVPVLFLGYLTYSASSYVPFAEFSRGARADHAWSCGLIAVTLGALVSGGILLAWRGTDALTPRLSGTLAGLIGGVGGAMAVGIGCPSHEAWHLWMAHGVMVLALGVMGFGAGRRLLAP